VRTREKESEPERKRLSPLGEYRSSSRNDWKKIARIFLWGISAIVCLIGATYVATTSPWGIVMGIGALAGGVLLLGEVARGPK
jgi:hypothetical protein